jgi:hypothetical protein
MLRPGRLDKLLYVRLPDAPGRYSILAKHMRHTPIAKDVDIKKIAYDKRCEGFSGADMAAIVREAAICVCALALAVLIVFCSACSVFVLSFFSYPPHLLILPSLLSSFHRSFFVRLSSWTGSERRSPQDEKRTERHQLAFCSVRNCCSPIPFRNGFQEGCSFSNRTTKETL